MTKNFDRLNDLFDELVPSSGKAESLAGELVRATARIGYRFYNDGDQIGIGYGKETCNPAARFLIKKAPREIADLTAGLWGMVSEAGTNWATILTLVDTDTSLGARVFRTKELGLAQGDFSLMGRSRLRLDYLPPDCELLGGDLVETSGLGGFYPSGLVIGSVEEVLVDDSGAASYAVLVPAVDFDALTEVFIVKEFEIIM
jgi:hypothetical protein